METVVANIAGQTRRAKLYGRDFIVAPVTLIVPGVLNGSQGPLFYPPDEVAKDPAVWNHMPLVVYHPSANGQPSSARDPAVLDKQGVGVLLNSRVTEEGKLAGEAWFDVLDTRRVHNGLLQRLEASQAIEVSTGLFTDNTPAANGANHNGKPYAFVARNYRPDHLAILPDQVGACSLKDGCGVNNGEGDATTSNATNPPKGEPKMAKLTETERKTIVDGLIANCGGPTTNCWKESDRATLNGLNDETLQTLAEQGKAAKAQAAVVANIEKGLGVTLNTLDEATMAKCKEAMAQKPPAKNEAAAQTPPPAKQPITENDLPAEIRADLAFARQERERQKAELVGKLTANLSDAEKAAVAPQLNSLSLDALKAIQPLAPKPAQQTPPSYAGAAAPTGNQAASLDQSDILSI